MHQRHRRSNSDMSSRYRERTCSAWWQPLTSSDFLLWHGRSIDLNTSWFWKPGYIHFSISILVGPHHFLGVFFCIFPCHHIPGLWYTNATPSPINLLFWSLTLLGKFHNVINIGVIQSWRSHIVIKDSSLVVLSATKRVLRRNRVMHSDVFKLRRIGLKANRTTGYWVFISDWFYKHTHLKANRTTGF